MDELREELERQERSGAWLARKVGCDPSLVARILNGERRPSADFQRQAAAALGRSVAELFPSEEPVAAP